MGHLIEEAAPIPEDVWERLPGDEPPETIEAWRRVYLGQWTTARCQHPGCTEHVSHPCEGCGRPIGDG